MRLQQLARKSGTWGVFAIALVYSVYLHRRLGMDGFWDTANYHVYLGWALWHAPAYDFGAVAQYQTFLNPLIDAVNYALFSVHPFLGAAFHSVCLALTLVAVHRITAATIGPDESRRAWPALAAVIGATGAMTVSLFGSFTNEHITALLIVSALGALVVWNGTVKQHRAAFVAGMLLGMAAGLKLTAAPYVAGLLLTVAIVSKFNLKSICLIVAGVALGLLLADGAFMVMRWQVYQNPIFPLANNIFHSQYFPLQWKSFGQFELHALPYYLSLPVRWLYSGDFSESNIVRDGRLLLGYIGVVLAFGTAALRRSKLRQEELLVICFFIFSWLAWILFFRIYRYLVVLELISGMVFVVGLLRAFSLAQAGMRVALPVLALGFLTVVTVYPDWGRRPWLKEFASSDVPKLIGRDKADVVFFADERVSYLAPELDAIGVPFRNLFSQSWYDGDRIGNPVDPRSLALSKGSKVYFLQYSKDDPRLKSGYLAGLFNKHLYNCKQSATNMVWSPFLCSFDEIRDIPQLTLGQAYDFASPALVFGSGWSAAEPAFRWSEGHASSIWVSLPTLPAACPLSVSIKGHTLGKQRVELVAAGQSLLNQEFAGLVDITVPIDSQRLAAGQPVEMNFKLPDAASPNNGDPRILAFALQNLRFHCD
jgi:hypothetical protein